MSDQIGRRGLERYHAGARQIIAVGDSRRAIVGLIGDGDPAWQPGRLDLEVQRYRPAVTLGDAGVVDYDLRGVGVDGGADERLEHEERRGEERRGTHGSSETNGGYYPSIAEFPRLPVINRRADSNALRVMGPPG